MIVNAKGGCGKTTLATNLAAFYACWGVRVSLLDMDPQGSSLAWLKVRPPQRPQIHGVCGTRAGFQIPEHTDYVIMDVPAGLYGEALFQRVREADTLIIPVLPSPIDIRAAIHFLLALVREESIRGRRLKVGIVANRVREHTRIYQTLESNLGQLTLPYVSRFRDTQNYIHSAAQGLGIFEMPARQVIRDLEQWQPLIHWLSEDPGLSVFPPS